MIFEAGRRVFEADAIIKAKPGNVALAEIEWLGQSRLVEVILSEGDDALIGTEMFAGAKLVIDYTNRSVTITD